MKSSSNKIILLIIILALVGALVWLWQSNANKESVEAVTSEEASVSEQINEEAAAPNPNEVSGSGEPVTLVAVGDIMLSRHVWTKILDHGGDPRHPFLETAELTKNADIAFANLETPVSDLAAPPAEGMSFIAPVKSIDGLEYAGFDIVSLANNHTENFGDEALLDSIEQLESRGIMAVGAGENIEQAHKPDILEVKGNKIAFLAYEDVVPDAYAAGKSEPGVAWMDIELLEQDIKQIRDEVDYVIISMHSGTEYVFDPIAAQKEFAHAAVDAGADLVIGHHPHVVQDKEIYKDKQIIYSLGNFVFDQMWSEETRRGEVLTATLDNGEVKDIEFTKIRIYDYNQPRIEEW